MSQLSKNIKNFKVLYIKDTDISDEVLNLCKRVFCSLIAIDSKDDVTYYLDTTIDIVVCDTRDNSVAKELLDIFSKSSIFFVPHLRDDDIVLNSLNIFCENLSLKDSLIKKDEEFKLFKSDIMTIFTHELKTPLNIIIGYSNYISRLLKKDLTISKIEKINNLSSKIYANGTLQSHMIENLLEVGKIQLNDTSIDKKRYNLYSLIEEEFGIYEELYEKDVVKNIDKDLLVEVDSRIFVLLFRNIFSNAIKYATSKVVISLYSDELNSFILDIEDDGEGIPKEQHKKVFDIFEQLDTDVLVREKEGMGLGLYIVKYFSDMCNIKLNLDRSKLLGGTKVTLCKDLG